MKNLISLVTAVYCRDKKDAELLRRLYLEGMKGQKGISKELVLIDDASPAVKETGELLEEIKRDLKGVFGSVRIIRNEINLGYTRAINKALGEVRGEVVGFVTSDVYLTKGVIDRMAKVLMADKKVGVVGPVSNGVCSRQQVWGVRPMVGLGVNERRRMERMGEKMESLNLPPMKVDFLQGHCYLIRKEVFDRFGGFDESLGMMYNEDIEFLERITETYKFEVDRRSFVYHAVDRGGGWLSGVVKIVGRRKIIVESFVEMSKRKGWVNWGLKMIGFGWYAFTPWGNCSRYFKEIVREESLVRN